jgi:hypothetical protein
MYWGSCPCCRPGVSTLSASKRNCRLQTLRWPYKFVHALLRIVMEKARLNLQANTAVVAVSERDDNGWITVKTPRGDVRTRTVVHATNRWASHLLPEFGNLIFGGRGTLASIKAPEGFIKHTGAQHWDHVVNVYLPSSLKPFFNRISQNYHIQLPPPYNAIIVGGGKSLLVHDPHSYILNDSEDQQFVGIPEFYQSWPAADIIDWPGEIPTKLNRCVNEGGCWSGGAILLGPL